MLKSLGKLRVGEVLEIYGMDYLENLELTLQQHAHDPNAPLDRNYAKLVKLEIRQRRQQDVKSK